MDNERININGSLECEFTVSSSWFNSVLPELNEIYRPFGYNFIVQNNTIKLENGPSDIVAELNSIREFSDDVINKAFLDIKSSDIIITQGDCFDENEVNEELERLEKLQCEIKNAGAQDMIRVSPMYPDNFYDYDELHLNKEIYVNGKLYSNYILSEQELEDEVDLLIKGKKSIISAEDKYPELPIEVILAKKDENGRVEGYIHIHMSDMIDNNYEDFLDLLSERLIGSQCLCEIDYEAVTLADNEPNTIILKVSGFVDDADFDRG